MTQTEHMKQICVINGVRYGPEHFLKHMAKQKKLSYIEFSHVSTLYSLCWVFQFRVLLQVNKKTERYAGYYGGLEESTMMPGKLSRLPFGKLMEIEENCILSDKLTEEKALSMTWEHNKLAILRKFKNLYAPPVMADHVTERIYKPMYVIRFHNKELNEDKYKLLDSLSGDLVDISVV